MKLPLFTLLFGVAAGFGYGGGDDTEMRSYAVDVASAGVSLQFNMEGTFMPMTFFKWSMYLVFLGTDFCDGNIPIFVDAEATISSNWALSTTEISYFEPGVPEDFLPANITQFITPHMMYNATADTISYVLPVFWMNPSPDPALGAIDELIVDTSTEQLRNFGQFFSRIDYPDCSS